MNWNNYKYILPLALLLGACQPGNVRQAVVPEQGPYLDAINRQAADTPDWFGENNAEQQKLRNRYKGTVEPELATYLENDIYLVDNPSIRRYHEKILARLLQGWAGQKPGIRFVFESDESLNAYVDVYNQIHVSSGLLRSVENEDQLASVLAHELSHVLLKHNQDKSATKSVSWSVEMAGALSIAAAGVAYNKNQNEKYKDYAEHALIGSQSLGLAWSDMLAPAWARNYERDADKLGLDLLMRADYNYEEFYKIIARLQDSNLRRSDRQRFFNAMAGNLLQQNRARFYSGNPDSKKDKALGDIKYLGTSMIASLTFDALAKGNVEHDKREQRIDMLKIYLQDAHQGGELPPVPDTASLRKALHEGEAKKILAADRVAIETIEALNRKELDTARKGAKQLGSGLADRVASVGIARSFFDTTQRNNRQATRMLTKVTRSPNAPAEAYLRLSRLYQAAGDYKASRSTLELGNRRIGRNYRFLPELVATHKALGDTENAERYAIECARSDRDNISLASAFLSGSNSASTAYYQLCSRKLGYDVVAKRRQEAAAAAKQQKQQRKQNKANLKEYKNKLKSLFDR